MTSTKNQVFDPHSPCPHASTWLRRSLSLAVVALLLLLSGDIESNPGPPSCKVQFKEYSFASTTCTQRRSVFMIALLLLAGIELNPGPEPCKQKSSIRVGTLEAWSAVNAGGVTSPPFTDCYPIVPRLLCGWSDGLEWSPGCAASDATSRQWPTLLYSSLALRPHCLT